MDTQEKKSSLLDGFVVFKFCKGAIAMTVENKQLSLSRSALTKINNPKYVKVLFNKTENMLAIVPAASKTDGCFHITQCKITSVLLLQKIRNILNLDNTQKITLNGTYDYDDKVQCLFFDLNQPNEK